MPGRCAPRLWLKGFTREFSSAFQPSPVLLRSLSQLHCLLFQRRPCQVLLFPSSGASDQVQVRMSRLRLVIVGNDNSVFISCCCLCCRHAGLSAAQQQLIRETLMKWLQCQVPKPAPSLLPFPPPDCQHPLAELPVLFNW